MRASLYFAAGALFMLVALGMCGRRVLAQEVRFPSMRTLRNTSDVDRLKIVDTQRACLYVLEHSGPKGPDGQNAIWGYRKTDPQDTCE